MVTNMEQITADGVRASISKYLHAPDCRHERVETVDFDTIMVCLDCGKEEVIA